MPGVVEPAESVGNKPEVRENDSAVPTATAPASAPDPLQAFAEKATDPQALRDAVVDAASVSGGLWLSYLVVFFYLAVAAGGVTHKDLFFENPVKLPFLNVDLPLLGFFVLGPLLFLIVHAYTLLHFALLADKVGAFDAALREQIADDDTRASLRRQLPSNIFVQFLAGPCEVRGGTIGSMLKGIAWISLVIGPVLLLVFFQLQFLPYHNEAISWWQRFTVVGDLIILWLLWPSVARGTTISLGWRDLRGGKAIACLAASVLPVLLVFTIATFPGEWLERELPSLHFVPISWDLHERASLHELLVAGEVNQVAERPRSLWSNRLVLPGISVAELSKFDSEAKVSALPVTISLRGRRLEGAVLLGARLPKADFTGAQLKGAGLSGADLHEAKFECAETGVKKRSGAYEGKCADLDGASLDDAELQGASFDDAELQRASLDRAQLEGVSLYQADLSGANLLLAKLQGAFLDSAHLQDASLGGAHLQGASLDGAHLQGASFGCAALMADGVQLKLLGCADLKGASVSAEQLQAAGVGEVQLQGTALVAVLRDAGCNAEGAPYVIRGFLRRVNEQFLLDRRFPSDPSQEARLVTAFLDEAHCPGAHGLSEQDKFNLQNIRDRVASSPAAVPQPVKP
jgi:uncharacterized protein YjbI with pentapeptide repeats